MVRKPAWLLPSSKKSLADVGVVSGTYVGPGEVPGVVRVELDDSDGALVNVPAGGGVLKRGASVRVQLRADGSPLGLLDSSGVASSSSDGVDYLGGTGEWASKAATSEYVDEQLAPAREQLEVLDEKLNDPETGLDAQQERANQIAADAEEARQKALEAINSLDGINVRLDQVEDKADQAVFDAAAAKLDAEAAQVSAQAAGVQALEAAGIAASKGKVIYTQADADRAENRNESTLFIDGGVPKRWMTSTSQWVAITDPRITAAASAADQAKNIANGAKEAADSAKAAADLAKTQAQAAQSTADAAQTAATAAQAKADGALAAAAAADGKAVAAQSAADAAAADLLALAGKSGRLIRSATAPTGTDRSVNNLWLNTSNGQLSQWTGSAWTLITDSRLTAAATAANAAQATADQAVQDAAQAHSRADAAMAEALGALSAANTANQLASTADGRYTVATANPTAANAAGKPLGAVWEVRSGSTALRRYVLTAATTWTQVKAGQDFIGAKAIGQAQIGDAAIGTAQIADAAITDAKIGDLSVAKLTVTSGAKIPTSVIDVLVNDEAFIRNLYANRIVVAGGNLLPDPRFGNKLFWSNASYVQENSGGENGGGSALIPATTSQSGFYTGITPANMVYNPQVVPGRKYKLRVRFRSNSAGTGTGAKITIYYRWYREDGTNSWAGAYVAADAVTFPANTWTTLEGETEECPQGATRLAFGLYVQARHNSAVRFSDPSVEVMAGATLIEPGAVTTEKLAVTEEMVARLAMLGDAWINNLTVDQARIAGELIGEVLTGKSIYGALIEGAKMVGGEYVLADEMDGLAPIIRRFSNTDVGWDPPFLLINNRPLPTVTGYATGGISGGRAEIKAVKSSYLIADNTLASLSIPNVSAQFGGEINVWVKTNITESLRINDVGRAVTNWKTCPANTWTKITVPLAAGTSSPLLHLEQKGKTVKAGVLTFTEYAAITVSVDRVEIIRVSPNPSKGQMRIGPDSNGSPEIKMTYGQHGASLRLYNNANTPGIALDGPEGNEQVSIGRGGAYYGIRLKDNTGKLTANLVSEGPESGLFLYKGNTWTVRLSDYGSEMRNNAGQLGLQLSPGFVMVDYSRRQSGTGGLYLTGVGSFDSTAAANLVRDGATGRVAARSSLRALKHDIQEITDDPKKILDIPIVSWVDRGQQERSWAYRQQQSHIAHGCHVDERDLLPDPGPLRRIPGVIAEDVEAAGLELLTERNPDGSLQSVAYERWAMYNTLVEREHEKEIRTLQNQIEALTQRLEKLEAENEKLREEMGEILRLVRKLEVSVGDGE